MFEISWDFKSADRNLSEELAVIYFAKWYPSNCGNEELK